MSMNREEMAQAVKKAMQAEFEGHHFYTMAAKNTEDPKAKEVFAALAAEEMDHFEYLRKHYTSILETGKPDAAAKLGNRMELIGASPIFSEKIRERIGGAHFEMTALSIAIQLEHDAEKFYKEMADKSEGEDMKALYSTLAEWEAGHYRAFLTQQDELKEDYWSQAGFSPF